jgi:hypothetical protein
VDFRNYHFHGEIHGKASDGQISQATTGIQISHDISFFCLFICRVLGAYVVFAVADSFFHFTPEKSYIQTLSELVRGVDPSATVVPVPVPTESIAPVVTEIVNTATSLLDQ